MDVVVICNGLGNQMSQYAFYLKKKSISKSTHFIFDRKSRLDHNGFELNRVFQIPYEDGLISMSLYMLFRILGIKKYPYFSKPLIALLGFVGIKLVYEKDNYDFEEKNLKPSKGITFYYGGWHSEKYFDDIKPDILESFHFTIPKEDIPTQQLAHRISGANSVSIHIRRGDYLSETNYNTFGAVCTKAYFTGAIERLQKELLAPSFFVFSNDVAWVKDNLWVENMFIVDTNKGDNSWKDMYLITLCKHHINSNSSFSWWGAWLSSYWKNIVIVPKYFINNIETKDVYPERWTSFKNY